MRGYDSTSTGRSLWQSNGVSLPRASFPLYSPEIRHKDQIARYRQVLTLPVSLSSLKKQYYVFHASETPRRVSNPLPHHLGLPVLNFLQVQAVCIGIEHLVKAHRRASEECNENGKKAAPVRCQLCESTRRVLRAAREHAKLVGHDQKNCDPCRMWAMVRARYTYLKRLQAANARAAAVNAEFEAKCSMREEGLESESTQGQELPRPSQEKRVRFWGTEAVAPLQLKRSPSSIAG